MQTNSNDKLADAHAQMVHAIESLVTGEDWAEMLRAASRFHRYSFGNVCLILAQRKDATRVGGYRTWRALGRQVRRGERGIAILAPCVTRGPRAGERDEDGRDEPASVVRGFRVAHVFDISQLTDTSPLPAVEPVSLEGDAPDGLWRGLAEQVAAGGFNLLRADCRPANGTTHFLARTVVVRPDLAPSQAAKVLAHELAHTRLHEGNEYRAGCRGRAEVEAESVAFLVCAAAGVGTGRYSFPYVARWADGDVALVRESAERVLGTARAITAALGLEPHLEAPTEAVLA